MSFKQNPDCPNKQHTTSHIKNAQSVLFLKRKYFYYLISNKNSSVFHFQVKPGELFMQCLTL